MKLTEWADRKADWLIESMKDNPNATPVYIFGAEKITTSYEHARHHQPVELIGYYTAKVLHKQLSADLAEAWLQRTKAAA